MIPVTVSNTSHEIGDPNWGQDDTLDREILELFFLQHNLEPSYPKNVKVRK